MTEINYSTDLEPAGSIWPVFCRKNGVQSSPPHTDLERLGCLSLLMTESRAHYARYTALHNVDGPYSLYQVEGYPAPNLWRVTWNGRATTDPDDEFFRPDADGLIHRPRDYAVQLFHFGDITEVFDYHNENKSIRFASSANGRFFRFIYCKRHVIFSRLSTFLEFILDAQNNLLIYYGHVHEGERYAVWKMEEATLQYDPTPGAERTVFYYNW